MVFLHTLEAAQFPYDDESISAGGHESLSIRQDRDGRDRVARCRGWIDIVIEEHRYIGWLPSFQPTLAGAENGDAAIGRECERLRRRGHRCLQFFQDAGGARQFWMPDRGHRVAPPRYARLAVSRPNELRQRLVRRLLRHGGDAD